jgi:outer membrane protein assembly factor BamD
MFVMKVSSSLARFLSLSILLSLLFAELPDLAANPAADEVEVETEASSSTASALMSQASEALANDKAVQALRLYRQVIRKHGTSIHTPEAHFQAALIRVDRKQWAKAFDHFQQIIDSHPAYPRFSEVINRQYEIAEALRQGARLRLFGRVPGLRSPERAVEYFLKIVENAPYSDAAPEALLKAAHLQIKQRKLDEAMDLYDRFISDYSRHESAPEAYFGLAEAFSTRVRGPEYDQGANREAISYFEDFMLLHPRHPRVPEAEARIEEMRDILAQSRVDIGDFYFFRRNNLTAARVFYNEAISISPTSPSADEAREKLVRVEARAERLN